MNFDSLENGAKKKLFLPNQSINIIYPNEKNIIVVHNHKKNEDYYEISSFDGCTLVLQKMVKRKAFHAKPKHQYHVSQWGEYDLSAQL